MRRRSNPALKNVIASSQTYQARVPRNDVNLDDRRKLNNRSLKSKGGF